jgi:hypothetical protein
LMLIGIVVSGSPASPARGASFCSDFEGFLSS